MFFSEFTCNRCQAEVRYSIRSWSYRLADDIECTLHASRVWCNDCNTLRSAEYFPTMDYLKAKIERLRGGQLPEWEVEYLSQRGMSKKDLDEFAADLLKEATVYLGLIEARQSPPRCLECASTNFVRIPERPDVVDDYFEHPGCGGTFHQTQQGRGRQSEYPTYDAEGNRLNDY